MTRFAVLGALCLAVLAFAGVASARTDDQAYQKARACLVSHGATNVRPQTSRVGGGWAEVHGQLLSWWYHPDYSTHVEGVSVAIGHGWSAQAKAMISGCLQKSVGLGPAGWLHITTE